MTTLEALASRVDVYSIDEAFLDLTGIDRVVSFEPFGRQAIWLKVESPDGYVAPYAITISPSASVTDSMSVVSVP